MTLTLTRERRKKFEAILSALGKLTQAEVEATAELLADAALSKSEKVRGIEAAMFSDRPVEASDLPQTDEEKALEAFERDLQCPGSWSWYPAKSSDEPAWKALREFVVSLYQSDPKSFEKYYTWARDPFSRGAKLPIHIRQDPTCFEYAWQAYQAANPSAGKSTEAAPVYTPPADEPEYVPAPPRKP